MKTAVCTAQRGAYGLYSTSSLFGNKNLNIGAAFTQNYNSDDSDEKANAHRIYLSFPNDKVEFDMAWQRSAHILQPGGTISEEG